MTTEFKRKVGPHLIETVDWFQGFKLIASGKTQCSGGA